MAPSPNKGYSIVQWDTLRDGGSRRLYLAPSAKAKSPVELTFEFEDNEPGKKNFPILIHLSQNGKMTKKRVQTSQFYDLVSFFVKLKNSQEYSFADLLFDLHRPEG